VKVGFLSSIFIRNFTQAKKFCLDALALCGYHLPLYSQNPVRFGLECARFASFLQQFKGQALEGQQRIICLRKLSKDYPIAFPRWRSLAPLSKNKVNDSSYTDLNEKESLVLEEIVKVEELLSLMLCTGDELDFSALFSAALSFPLYFVSAKSSQWRKRTAYKSIGFCLDMLAMIKSSQHYHRLASSAEKETPQSNEQLYVMLDVLYDGQVSVFRRLYDYEETMVIFGELYNAMKEAGLQFSSYIAHIAIILESAKILTGLKVRQMI
jgi:hypothetical protein